MQAAAARRAGRGGDEPGAAQARQRPALPRRRARPALRRCRRALLPRAEGARCSTWRRDALAELRARFDVVICEGAGSPAEVNLRDSDLANMALARAADLPVIVVGDIDRGGVLAHFAGTLGVLEPRRPAPHRRLRRQQVPRRSGAARTRARLARRRRPAGRRSACCRGARGCGSTSRTRSISSTAPSRCGAPVGDDVLRIAVVRLPRMSNVTDVDALSAEPGVEVRLVTSPAALADADLVVLPGSRATVSDLDWLRDKGFDRALHERAAAGRPVIGICGGVQLLGTSIVDGVESGAGYVEGLGLLPVTTRYAPDKVLDPARAGEWRGHEVTAYAIHHGRVTRRVRRAVLRRRAGRRRSGARRGTASSRTTASGARSSARSPPTPAGAGCPATSRSPTCARPGSTRWAIWSSRASRHDAIWRLIEDGRPGWAAADAAHARAAGGGRR